MKRVHIMNLFDAFLFIQSYHSLFMCVCVCVTQVSCCFANNLSDQLKRMTPALYCFTSELSCVQYIVVLNKYMPKLHI